MTRSRTLTIFCFCALLRGSHRTADHAARNSIKRTQTAAGAEFPLGEMVSKAVANAAQTVRVAHAAAVMLFP
jgi:hypothetical protein